VEQDRGVAQDERDQSRWLALAIAECCKLMLALISKKYPEAKAARGRCPECARRVEAA
jgi:hypothetical protein